MRVSCSLLNMLQMVLAGVCVFGMDAIDRSNVTNNRTNCVFSFFFHSKQQQHRKNNNIWMIFFHLVCQMHTNTHTHFVSTRYVWPDDFSFCLCVCVCIGLIFIFFSFFFDGFFDSQNAYAHTQIWNWIHDNMCPLSMQ